MPKPPTAAAMITALRASAEPTRIAVLQGFFKTGPGQYGEGDRFIGVRLPVLRVLARQCHDASLVNIEKLLASPIHEARLLAVLLLVRQFHRAKDDTARRRIYDFYLSHARRINSWDLVDVSAPGVVGRWLLGRSGAPLRRLARSENLWERRIAIVATHCFIRQGYLDETFRIADILLHDSHDLIHKAVGWMLRETGHRDARRLKAFLATRHDRMPRTMLRYAIERFPERERRTYLQTTTKRTATAGRGAARGSASPSGRSPAR
jgi:3-methyladenine DNA glycosylase AlkD